MKSTVQAIVIGAGVGGLAAAIQLSRRGVAVRVLEARAEAGGLASGFAVDGFSFDYGPYILLDRPGLEWSFQQFGECLSCHVQLRPVEDIYRVVFHDGMCVNFYSDVERTASEFDRRWPGSAKKYIVFVRSTAAIHQRLSAMLHIPRPGISDIFRAGAWRDAPFLARSLEGVLTRTGLPSPLVNAIGIWTHVAGQNLNQAPSPLAFVPAVFHTVGCYVPAGGIRQIALVLTSLALNSGVQFEFNGKVKKIHTGNSRVKAVETEAGDLYPADVIISNHSAIGTYMDLLDGQAPEKSKLEQLPLQSPGVCAYLAIKDKLAAPYLHFYLPSGEEPCRLLINSGLIVPEEQRDGWYPARLLSPMRYADAQNGGSVGQRQYLEKIMAESWWKGSSETRLLATQIPQQWEQRFNLYRASMNPVMTASFMRAGRMPHRSPHFQGLYFAGSSTHPGQWVSFCAISGILAAQCVLEDLGC